MSDSIDNRLPASSVMSLYVQGLFFTAREYKESAETIFNHSNRPKTYAFHLLANLSIELYLKTLIASSICEQNTSMPKDELVTKVKKEISSYGHRIDDLLNVCTQELAISSIFHYETGAVDQYEIKRYVKDKEVFFIIKSLQSLRYGKFANTVDHGIIAQYDGYLLEFVIDLDKSVDKTYVDMCRHLDHLSLSPKK